VIPSGTLEQRLERNLQNVYEILQPPQQAIVQETAVPGEARVVLTLPEGCLCIQWNLPTGLFRVLQKEANADGAFVLRCADGGFEAHVVECKKTVNLSKWAEARTQMRWTLSRLRGLSGVLGIELRRGVLYTAFRTDDLSPESAPNPTAQRRPTGPDEGGDGAGLTWNRRAEREWVDDELSLAGFDGRFAHRKIELDEHGAGSTCFASG
jgi:hypothetical protein